MTTAVHAHGLVLKMALDGLDASLAPVAGIHSIKWGAFNREMLDATDFDSPEAWKEKIKGLKEAGEFTLDINWKPTEATHADVAGMLKDFDQEDIIPLFAIVLPPLTGTTTWKFAAAVTGFSMGAQVGGKLTASVTLTPTGKPGPF